MNLSGQNRYSTDEVVDVVVVGTGAGGAPLLAELAAAGLKVVALEAGPNFDPAGYGFDETLADEIYWTEERLSGGSTRRPSGQQQRHRRRRLDPALGRLRAPGRSARLPAERRDRRGLRLADRPRRTGAVLRPGRAVHRHVGPTPYPWDEARRFPLPPVLRNGPAQIMASACQTLGITATDAPAAVVSRDFTADPAVPERKACINCGFCHQGCRTRAKASMDVTYLPLAVARGAEIRAEARVHGVERDKAGRITAVIYRSGGRDHRQRCANLILCAGAVETPRLLLHLDLATGSGQVGRNYIGHVATQVWGTFADEVGMNRGYPSSLITEDYTRPKGADFAGGYLVQSLGVEPLTWANAVARGRGLWGTALTDYLRHYNRVAGIGINGETLPCDANVLTLSDETDALGMRKAKVDFGYGSNEDKLNAHATKLMREIWEAAGASDIWVLERVAHTLGTCRMGRNPDASVVDAYGRSHEVENLWICDGSVFPSSLAANPALTIMALSLRTAGAFLKGPR